MKNNTTHNIQHKHYMNYNMKNNINSYMEDNTQNNTEDNEMTYDKLLENMGMFVKDGKLYFYNKQTNDIDFKNSKYSINSKKAAKHVRSLDSVNSLNTQIKIQKNNIQANNNTSEQLPNHYIYNKYFKSYFNNQVKRSNKPTNIIEYRNMVIRNIIQRARNNLVKSKKLLIPNLTISYNYYRPFYSNKNMLFNVGGFFAKGTS